MSKILAMVAGKGDLPQRAATYAKEQGYKVIAVCFDESVKNSISSFVDELRLFGIGQAGKTVRFFKEHQAVQLLFIGKIEKKLAFRDILLDATGIKIMAKAARKTDSNIMHAVIEAVEAEGMKVEKQTSWLPEAMPAAGQLGRHALLDGAAADIEFGLPLCKELAGKDVGQTMLVKDGTVIAVEAVEGTDEAIERAGRLAKGCVMLKCSRPKQDLRFDIPAIGVKTIGSLKAAGATTLAIEACGVVVVDMAEVIKAADAAGIALVSV